MELKLSKVGKGGSVYAFHFAVNNGQLLRGAGVIEKGHFFISHHHQLPFFQRVQPGCKDMAHHTGGKGYLYVDGIPQGSVQKNLVPGAYMGG